MAQQPTTKAAPSGCPAPTPPQRFIYTQADMEAFRSSPAKKELLTFATALGRSCTNPKPAPGAPEESFSYDPSNPLRGLAPGTASLHGSLRHIAERWLAELPPDTNAKARFGNPAFRAWHGRLVERSAGIVKSILDCHRRHGRSQTDATEGFSEDLLQQCSEAGYSAASGGDAETISTSAASDNETRVVAELCAYLHDGFGHPTRLDYGTGHESSFLVFLYTLCKLGCFGQSPPDVAPSRSVLAPVALSLFSQYLAVTRGLQRDYMLEPAGSHGVWGLDDYHCLPFFFGACQLVNDPNGYAPSAIHDDHLLRRAGDEYLYFGCIRYIKELKKGVPFFESSPMLDDISRIGSWEKVSGGLLRLFEGEVLDKKVVVQHFVFGDIFKATWSPSQQPREAPKRTFINGPGGDECIAPWAAQGSDDLELPDAGAPPAAAGLPPTRAPWAK